MEASLDVGPQPVPAARTAADPALPAFDPVDDDAGEGARLRPIVYGLDAVLLFVGLTNLLAAILLSLRERARNLGLLRAAGLTPGQATAVFLTSQAGVAVVAALAGIPIGLAVFRLAIEATGSTDEFAYAPLLQLGLLAPAAVVLVLALAAPFARRAAAGSAARPLRYE
jgi:putative ABC transport system permease protein